MVEYQKEASEYQAMTRQVNMTFHLSGVRFFSQNGCMRNVYSF